MAQKGKARKGKARRDPSHLILTPPRKGGTSKGKRGSTSVRQDASPRRYPGSLWRRVFGFRTESGGAGSAGSVAPLRSFVEQARADAARSRKQPERREEC